MSALGVDRAVAQNASPEATPASEATGSQPAWLFTVDFDSGSIEPVEDTLGNVTITLSGIDPVVLAFTEHPFRRSAFWTIDQLLAAIETFAANPLNAVLSERQPRSQDSGQIVVRLLSGTFASATGMLTLQADVFGGIIQGTPIASGDMQALQLGGGFLFVDDISNPMCVEPRDCDVCYTCDFDSETCVPQSGCGSLPPGSPCDPSNSVECQSSLCGCTTINGGGCDYTCE